MIFSGSGEKCALRATGVPIVVRPLLYNKEKTRGAIMGQNSEKICSVCGKKFDMWDEQEDFCIK